MTQKVWDTQMNRNKACKNDPLFELVRKMISKAEFFSKEPKF